MKETNKKRVVVLDTFAIIFRAYHALPDFSTSKGEPTGALFGVASMLMSIITDLKPDYILAAYDLPGGSFRNDVEDTYKANRKEADEALVVQITKTRDLLKAFSIPIFEKEGYEADDILGTISEILKKEDDIEVVIASGDMDTLQLVDGKKVKVFTIRKGIKDTILYDEKGVVDRFSFGPELLPDYKGLRGDPSDNIIGIKGIGEKTATDLISNFGSLENMYKKLKKDQESFLKVGIKPRIINLLIEGEEEAFYSKSLATIVRDVPISFHLPSKPWREMVQPETILAIFQEFEFRALVTRAKDFFNVHNVSQTEEEVVKPEDLKRAAIMLWIINSDKTNATLEDILAYTKQKDFQSAQKFLEEKIQENKAFSQVFEEIEKPLMNIVANMQTVGISVEKETLSKLSVLYHAEIEKIEKKIFSLAGKEFNVRSPQQLSDILFNDLGLSTKGVKKGASGGFSTNVSVLEKLEDQHEIVKLILEHRELAKLLSTYIDTLPELIASDGRIHAEFIQNGATTGRFSSNNPNLQNIPTRSELGRAIRSAFVAEKGFVFAGFDYSQIELRLAAILAQDTFMIETFKQGKDIHAAVASRVFDVKEEDVTSEMRRRAKIINFGIIYGMGISALQKQIGTDRKEAQEFYDNYFKEFGQIQSYLEATKVFARAHGYTETMFGRRRNFESINSKTPFIRAMAERMATNAPIQGTGADIVKLAMIHVDRYIKEKGLSDKVRLLLQVHDELIYEIEEKIFDSVKKEIETIMESVFSDCFLHFQAPVPLRVDGKSGYSWFDLK